MQGTKLIYAPFAHNASLTHRGRRVTELVERYRRNAEKCLELVQTFNDPEAKRALLVMANAWLTLAAQREKYKTAPPNEPPSLRFSPADSDEPKLEC